MTFSHGKNVSKAEGRSNSERTRRRTTLCQIKSDTFSRLTSFLHLRWERLSRENDQNAERHQAPLGALEKGRGKGGASNDKNHGEKCARLISLNRKLFPIPSYVSFSFFPSFLLRPLLGGDLDPPRGKFVGAKFAPQIEEVHKTETADDASPPPSPHTHTHKNRDRENAPKKLREKKRKRREERGEQIANKKKQGKRSRL